MKARLGELQARLDSHEKQRIHTTGHGGNDMTQGVSSVPIPFGTSALVMNGHSSTHSLTGLNSVLTNGRGGEVSQSPLSNDQSHALPILQTNMYDIPADESTTSLFSHNPQFLNSPPNSHSSPQAHNALPSPPGRSDSEQSAKVSQDFVLDCLRFQSQLLNRLNTLQNDPACTAQGQYSQPEGLPQCTLTPSPLSDISCELLR